jgi:hypothetical protein
MKGDVLALMEWIFFGALFGAILSILSDLTERQWGPEAIPTSTASAKLRRIVILGGGFGGMKTAECLEEQLGGDNSVSLSLVSETMPFYLLRCLGRWLGAVWSPVISVSHCAAAFAALISCAGA